MLHPLCIGVTSLIVGTWEGQFRAGYLPYQRLKTLYTSGTMPSTMPVAMACFTLQLGGKYLKEQFHIPTHFTQ